MSKQLKLKIDECKQCPHLKPMKIIEYPGDCNIPSEWTCKKTGNLIDVQTTFNQHTTGYFPSWCPLENTITLHKEKKR